MRARRVLPVAAVLALAGCGSPPARFYRLTTATPQVPARQIGGPPIEVQSVGLPPMLDRQALVSGTGGTSVDVSGRDRWAAPLDGMIQRVLAADLQALLPGEVRWPGDLTPTHATRSLRVNIAHFMPDAAGEVRLVADWALFDHGTNVAGGHEAIRVAAREPQPAAETAAMSRALGVLAERIAGQVPAMTSPHRGR